MDTIDSSHIQSPTKKKILILGGGFAGSKVLTELQRQKRSDIEILLVNQENFFLFTPMLPEISSGMLKPSDITVPIRAFSRNSQFYQAMTDGIDLEGKKVSIVTVLDKKAVTLDYDYLILALGSKNNFYGNKNIERYSLTIKTLEDALSIRDHVINVLEAADQERDPDVQESYLRFAVVGAGFAGVEIATEINHFIRSAVKSFYKNIDYNKIRVTLVSAKNGIMPELGDELGKFSLDYIRSSGIEIITNTKVIDAEEGKLRLGNGQDISCRTMIWAGGVMVDPIISSLKCKHDQSGRVMVDQHLRVEEHDNVFALGDCAHSVDPHTNQAYPPTAQIAVRQAKLVSKNVLTLSAKNSEELKIFRYANRGYMATIGKRMGVGYILGRKISGLPAWILWRSYYWINLPTADKKIRVAIDWFLDSLFRTDIMAVGIAKRPYV